MRPGLGFAACQSKKGNSLIIRLLPLQGVGLVWRIFTQGAALGYVLLPLRGVPLVSFDTPHIFIYSWQWLRQECRSLLRFVVLLLIMSFIPA